MDLQSEDTGVSSVSNVDDHSVRSQLALPHSKRQDYVQQKILWAEVRRHGKREEPLQRSGFHSRMNGPPSQSWPSCAPRRWKAGWDREHCRRNRARAERRTRNWKTRRARTIRGSKWRESFLFLLVFAFWVGRYFSFCSFFYVRILGKARRAGGITAGRRRTV